jgi:two-component system OmpR family sensor kinase
VSLRARILTGIALVVALGLGAAGVATYAALRGFLVGRIDEQLAASIGKVADELAYSERGGSVRAAKNFVPAGTYAELRSGDGAFIKGYSYTLGGTDAPEPTLPVDLGLDGDDRRSFTIGAEDGKPAFRVLVVESVADGQTLVLAAPMDDVESTLGRLVRIELTVAGVVLMGSLALGWWAVAFGFRPLRRMETTAEAIAAGDLSQRVPTENARTEVGRLGTSLNTMLGTIESAFAEKEATEQRLRRFVADASHELRTPLTSVRAHAELFRRGARDRPDDLDTVMRRIEDETVRMGVLVDDLLLLARLDQGRPLEHKPVDLAALAADAVADQRVVDPGRPVELDAPRPVIVAGDDGRLRQVLANLLGNVRAHTPPGTPLRVVARTDPDSASAVLEVADQGPGLGAGEAEQVFARFYRADRSRSRATGGTGLGLSIVAAIAVAHGGRAEVESTPGQGARFRVLLPLGV